MTAGGRGDWGREGLSKKEKGRMDMDSSVGMARRKEL